MLARERERERVCDQQQQKACWLLIYWGPQTPKTREEEEEEEDPQCCYKQKTFSHGFPRVQHTHH